MTKKNKSVLIFILIIGGYFAYNYYQKVFGKNITKTNIVYIGSDYNLMDVKKTVTLFSDAPENFFFVARKKNFTQPKGGKYVLKKGMSMNEVVNLLRSGSQTPVKVSFNNQHTLEKFAGRIATQIEADSISLLTAFKDATFLANNDFTSTSVLGICIPNSYEFYWNTSAEKFRNRMLSEYHRFWNSTRLEKAKQLKLSKKEVITLASIVQKETQKVSERPIIAGLYLNRFKNKWALQADPTVIYALKQQKGQNFEVKRVLNKDLKINSPYNTYKNVGLPPTLIAMPDISSIDAVLNYQKHNYYYMCASVTKMGYHDFAKTLSQHNRNARKYQRWVSKQGVLR